MLNLGILESSGGGSYAGPYLVRPLGAINTTSTTTNAPANTVRLVSFTTPAGADSKVDRVFFRSTSANNGLRARAMVTDTSGNVLGQSGNVTFGTGRLATFPLTADLSLAPGTTYLCGLNFESSTTIAISQPGTGYSTTGVTFGSALPGTLPALSNNGASAVHCWVACQQEGTPAGSGIVAESADGFVLLNSNFIEMPLPTDYAIDDIAFIHVQFEPSSGTPTLVTPDEWTLISEQAISGFYKSGIYARRIDGTESPVIYVSQTGATMGAGGITFAKTSIWRGVTTAGTFYEGLASTTGTTNAPTGSAVVTTGANRLIVNFWSMEDDTAFTKNASWSLAYDETTTQSTDASLYATTLSAPTATSYAAEVASLAGSERWRCHTLALIMA